MAKTLTRSVGCKVSAKKSKAKSEKPKKLSKYGEWILAHPSANGANGTIYDMRAVMGSKAKPKKLSKAGEWILAHPSANGANGTIYDMRAVMK